MRHNRSLISGYLMGLAIGLQVLAWIGPAPDRTLPMAYCLVAWLLLLIAFVVKP